MEEYEPHVIRGNVIYAGVDYEAIVRAAEEDPDGCDVILWDGGNNDFPFYKSDLHVTVVDPHRPGHELTYYPGEVTLRIADVVVINKMDSADAAGIQTVRRSIAAVNPGAIVVDAASTIKVQPEEIFIISTPITGAMRTTKWLLSLLPRSSILRAESTLSSWRGICILMVSPSMNKKGFPS
jgi:predicted GTPase